MMKIKHFYLVLIVIFISSSYSAEVSISGLVKSSENSQPIPGAIISIKNSSVVFSTNNLGEFKFEENIPQRAISSKTQLLGNVRFNSGNNVLTWTRNVNVKSIKVFSLNGKSVFNFKNSENQAFVKLPKLASSILILRIKTDKKSVSMKMFPYQNMSLDLGLGEEKKQKQSRSFSDSITIQISHPNFITSEKRVTINNSHIDVYLSNSPTADIFSDDRVNTYSVTIDERIYDSLHLTAKEELYQACTLSFNGEPVGTVGIRFQGSGYHMNLYFDENGNKLTPKVSFKFKFNKYDPLKRFFGLKKLILNAMDTDYSCLRNSLAYDLFNDVGIHACQTAFARLEINGKYEGLFLIIEPVDGEYLDKRFSGFGNGNLFKETWPGNTSNELALKHLKTKEYIGNVNRFLDFNKAVSEMNEDNFISEISKWIDLDNLLKFIAVDRAVVSSDGIMTWYVEGKFSGNHNYYWYEENKVNGKFHLLPWDYDCSFYASDAVHDLAGVPRWNEKPTGKEYTIFGDSKVIAPSEDNFIYLLGQTCWNRYVKIAEKFLNNQFSKDSLLNKIERIETLIEPHLRNDPNLKHDTNLTGYETWQVAVERFKNSIDQYRGRFESLLEGPDTSTIPDPDLTPFDSYSGLWYEKNNNFEFKSNPTVLPNIYAYASESTVCEIELNTENPLSGNSDLKLSTYYYPTPGQWSEWAAYFLQMKNSSYDLTNTKKILITAKASKSTAVRLTLISDAYPNPHGAKYGITFNVDTVAEVCKLDPNFFYYPDWASQTDVKDEVLKTCTGFEITPEAACTDDGSLLDRDTSVLFIDDIRFIE